VTTQPPFRSTITQALADTVIDDSRSEPGRSSWSEPDVSGLPGEGDLVGGMYRLVRLLGAGTFGKVYVAERTDVPEHRVALKLTLRDAYSGRDVKRELTMLAAASHPHMVQLKDHGVTPTYVWFTMPVFEGETLADRLRRSTLSLVEAHEVFVPIARSLEALHRAGLRHQDLKPDNVFLAQFGGRVHPIILDLGVAAERASKFVAGTIIFASPEQTIVLTGSTEDVPLSEKMDTYGLAATLLLSLVGMEYYPGANAGTREEMATAQQQRAEQPIDPDALTELTGPPRRLLQDAFRSWFAIDAEVRPSMTEMAEGLDVLLEKQREENQSEERLRARQKTNLLRMRLAVLVLVLLGLTLLGVGVAKRETIELANELATAKRIEKQSFDTLQSCETAQGTTKIQLGACELLRDRERTQCQENVSQQAKASDRVRDELSAQLMVCGGKLKTAEDELETANKTHHDANERLIADHRLQVGRLTDERDGFQRLADERQGQVEAHRDKAAQCQADLAARSATRSSFDNPYDDPSPQAGAQPTALPGSPPSPTTPPQNQPPVTPPATTKSPPAPSPAATTTTPPPNRDHDEPMYWD